MVDPALAAHDVVLVGSGERARAWGALLRRSTRLSLVAVVTREPVAACVDLGVPRLRTLAEALAAHPAARVAAALPPRAGLDAALALAARGVRGVVEAPLHRSLGTLALDAAAATGVQVAHGWVTLPGARWLRRLLDEQGATRVEIEARGLPEEPGGDVDEALAHALALAARLVPAATIVRATPSGDARVEAELIGADAPSVRVVAHAGGRGVRVRLVGDAFEAELAADGELETRALRLAGARREERAHPIPSAEVRALHQLADPAAARGDSLVEARHVARLLGAAHELAARRPLAGARALAMAARIALVHPNEPLASLGLEGRLPEAPPARTLYAPTPPEPLELWPYRAGVKPVAFLTVEPGDVDAVIGCFGGAYVERRERRVEVGPQDRWLDRRERGAPRVELYVSREPELARRAARLQAEGDPSGSVTELGRLMGYPPCCVEAFAAQLDRANNTRNRYATASRSPARGPWPFELANLHTMLLPFFPCTYACSAALDLARRALDAMDAAHPGSRDALSDALARPVLYFDHERQVVLHGSADHDSVRYAGASVPAGTDAGFARLAAAIALGDELAWTDDALVVRAGGRELFRLRRTDPGLGLLAPFGRPLAERDEERRP